MSSSYAYRDVSDIFVYKKDQAFKDGINPSLESIKETDMEKISTPLQIKMEAKSAIAHIKSSPLFLSANKIIGGNFSAFKNQTL